MAEPAAGCEQHVREPGSWSAEAALRPHLKNFSNARSYFRDRYFFCSSLSWTRAAPVRHLLQLLPPGAVDPASLTPVTPPTYIGCSTPAATIITDMLPA